jgi:hypothetical protein
MDKLFRITVIGKIREGVPRSEVDEFMALKMAEKGLRDDHTIQWIPLPSPGGERLFAKFSTVIPEDQLDDAWNLRASRFFAEAGYGDVAWKITPVQPDDPECENTTCSIPSDLFKAWLENDDTADSAGPSEPPDPFGSDQSWTWFEDFENKSR